MCRSNENDNRARIDLRLCPDEKRIIKKAAEITKKNITEYLQHAHVYYLEREYPHLLQNDFFEKSEKEK